jgi:hypothetical protein
MVPDIRPEPLQARKASLGELLSRSVNGIQFNLHVEGITVTVLDCTP